MTTEVKDSLPQIATGKAVRSGALLSGIAGVALFGNVAYQVLIAAMFGTGRGIAVYLGVLAVPSLIVNGIAYPFNSVIVPAIVRIHEMPDGSRGRANIVTRTCITVTLLGASLISLVCCIASHWIVAIALPGLSNSDVSYGANMFCFALVGMLLQQGVGQVFSSIFNAYGEFFLPALAGIIYVAVNILILLVLHQRLGAGSLALGTLVGAIASVSYLLVLAVRRLEYRPAFCLNDPEVRDIGRSALPLILTVYVTGTQPILERYFASQISLKALAYLAYADRLISYYTTFTSSGFVTTFFTLVARFAARSEWESAARATVRAVRILLMVGVPALVAAIFLRTPLLALFLERGSMGIEGVHGIGNAVLGYGAAFIMAGLGSIIIQAFFVRKRTRIVAVVTVLRPLVFVMLAPTFVHIGSYVGLAVASSAAWTVMTLVLYLLASRSMPDLLSAELGLYVLQVIMGAVLAGATADWVLASLPHIGRSAGGALALGLDIALLVLILGYVFRLPEVTFVIDRLRMASRPLLALFRHR